MGISMLTDSFGRGLDYLRVSVTDRCNLRCFYCMPQEGVEWKPHDDILSFEEIIRVVNIMAGLGVKKIRVTGGEPLLRRGTSSFLKNLKTISGIENVTLTTNGLLLGAYLDGVESLGKNSLPDGINISLDAIDNKLYRQITHCDDAKPEEVFPLIDLLLEKNILVKINCVIMVSVNESEILPLAELSKNKNIIVRFIELMPFGSASDLKPVSGQEAAAHIEKVFGVLTPFDGISGSGPAVYYSLSGFTGKIGFINAVTHGFCETCNRLRLTSEGFLRLCLFNDLGVDLRKLLRSGVNDKELADIVSRIVEKKPRVHTLSGVYGDAQEHLDRMSWIGG